MNTFPSGANAPAADPATFTSFEGTRLLATGPLADVAVAVAQAARRAGAAPVQIFDDVKGEWIDIDTRGSDDDIRARYAPQSAGKTQAADTEAPRGRGRPRLGVVAREVTLLPRHWEWLAAQSGGASVALRKLVDEARRAQGGQHEARLMRERAYRFMSSIAGNLAGFEEANRALFSGDRAGFLAQTAGWPADVREHAAALGFGQEQQGEKA